MIFSKALATLLMFGLLTPTQSLLSPSRQSRRLHFPKLGAGIVDEILDGLDTLAGVSPLSEADLKSSSVNLSQRMKERDEEAPPADALAKPSVSIFFFLLGLVPVLLSIVAIQSGVRPFGL